MEEKRRKPNILLRFLAFLVTVALVLGALALVVFREELNMDALKRYITYRSLTRDADGQAQSFPYDGSINDAFADLDGSLLVAGDSGVRLYSPAGVLLAEEPVVLKQPVAYAAGKYAVVYDAGGTALRLFNGSRQLLSLESDGTLLSATVNSSGWLAVVHQASGHKGAVSVYDAKQQKKMQFNFSSRFVVDAQISEDNSTLGVVTIGQEEDGFRSCLSVYSLAATLAAGSHSDNEPQARYDLGGCVALSVRGTSGKFRVAGDSSLAICSAAGTSTAVYDYSDRYLKSFSLGGEDFTVLLLGKYRAGSAAELTVVSDDGQTAASLSMNEQLLSLSAAGRYIGVLTADRLDIYTRDLALYSSLEGTAGARRVLMRADGSAMLIGSETAYLYLPA